VACPDRRPRWDWAIANWELTHLARRGSPTIARLLAALLLFAAPLITYLAALPRDLDGLKPGAVQAKLSDFGQRFALQLLLVQATVVFVLTPLFVAASIVEEIEQRTLEFLLATDLRPREIILGKLWPRLMLLFGVVLVVWPVLAATQLWGGVDDQFVGLGSLVILAELWAIAEVSVACAVGMRTLRRAMIRSYCWSAVALTLPLFTRPAGVIVVLSDVQSAHSAIDPSARQARLGLPPPTPSATALIVVTAAPLFIHFSSQFLIGLWGLRRATYKLQHARYFYARMPWQEQPPKPQKWQQHPPVPEGSPLLWKDLYLSGQTNRFVRSLSLIPWWLWLSVSSVGTLVIWAIVAEESDDAFANINGLIRWGGGLFVGLMAVVVGLHAAGSVARERQQETLTDLMTIPRPRQEILTAKWIGSQSKVRRMAMGMGAIPLVGVLANAVSIWAVVPLLLTALAALASEASFGLWLSVRAPTVQRATGPWLLTVGLWIGGTFLAAQAAYMEERAAFQMSRSYPPPKPNSLLFWDRALNPLLAWSQLSFRFLDEDDLYSSWEFRDGQIKSLKDIMPSVIGIGVHGLLAWVLFAAASRRFEREGRE
jgi:ABC-type transport system involved in multi-copper enzyme maturation permease subunit